MRVSGFVHNVKLEAWLVAFRLMHNHRSDLHVFSMCTAFVAKARQAGRLRCTAHTAHHGLASMPLVTGLFEPAADYPSINIDVPLR